MRGTLRAGVGWFLEQRLGVAEDRGGGVQEGDEECGNKGEGTAGGKRI